MRIMRGEEGKTGRYNSMNKKVVYFRLEANFLMFERLCLRLLEHPFVVEAIG